MRSLRNRLTFLALLFIVPVVQAATFLVPSDRELIRRSPSIVRGTVLDSFSETTSSGSIRTITEVRVADVIKGSGASGSLIRVSTIGGVVGTRAFIVPGAPQFFDGEEVLLFLEPDRPGQWATVDLTLGKFTRATSTRGESLFVRDAEEIFGWDAADNAPHREPVRLAEPFVRFVREVALGGNGVENYLAPPATVYPKLKAQSLNLVPQPAAVYTATSYLQQVTISGITRGVRWPSFGGGVGFRNYGTQSGAPNGGIDAISAGSAMWTNDCASTVVYTYAGSTTTQQCLNTADGINGVGFNDPCNEIAGSFTGSGTLGLGGFWADSTTTTVNGETMWSITEGNVVLQDNLQAWGGVGQAVYMNALLAHELGHTLGFRHSDQNPSGGACDPNTMECSSAAIMKASLTTAYTDLQAWDQNAVRAVYPGGSCGGGGIKKRADFDANGNSDIWWRNTSTGDNSIWYTNGSGFNGGANPPRAGTVEVFSGTGDFNNDNRADVLWRNSSTGAVSVWFMNGGAIIGGLSLPAVPSASYVIAGIGDFNGDGYADIFWRNTSTGANSFWYITASGFAGGANPPPVTDLNLTVAAVSDFNGDGRADILWRHNVTGANYTWLMNGGTIAGGSQLPTVPVSYVLAGTGDFNADGTFDLLWRSTTTGDNSIWFLSNGAFFGSGLTLPSVSPASGYNIAAVGDFNGDNRYDLLWRNTSNGSNSIWFITASGFGGGPALPSVAGNTQQIVAPRG